ncbi:MAG TPA: hypothetical protein VIX89_06790, partial [Bryobacteraceae bacterium]
VGKSIENQLLLAAALEGLQLQKQRIEEQIRDVRLLLGKSTGTRGRPPGSANKKTGPGRLSPAARKRIAAAQKRRWAEYRKSSAGA